MNNDSLETKNKKLIRLFPDFLWYKKLIFLKIIDFLGVITQKIINLLLRTLKDIIKKVFLPIYITYYLYIPMIVPRLKKWSKLQSWSKWG